MKLIDKDALVAEIEKKINSHYFPTEYNAGIKYGLGEFLKIINTLEVKEVDLDEEITIAMPHRYCWSGDGSTMLYTEEQMKDFAKHFFELGLNTQHNSINIPNIDNILEEGGIDPFSKEAKIFKESYCMALGKFKAQKGK